LLVGAVTVEEVMELATSRYIDFLGVGFIDLEAPQLPGKVLDVVTERMFAEPSILETIASILQALHQYERAGGFSSSSALEVAEMVLEESTAGTESVADASVSPPTSEGQEASLPQPAEAAKTTVVAAATGAAEGVVGEVGLSSPRLFVVSVDEAVEPEESAAALQERVAPKEATRSTSPEIQEVEEDAGAALLQGAVGGEARTLELACTSWAATSEPGGDAEDDEEVAAHNTLERELNWACRAFDELILPATSVSLSRSTLMSPILWSSWEVPLILASPKANHRVIGQNGPS
jgi:hypothetical protein